MQPYTVARCLFLSVDKRVGNSAPLLLAVSGRDTWTSLKADAHNHAQHRKRDNEVFLVKRHEQM